MEKLERRIKEAEKALRTLKEISQEPYSVIVRDATIQRFEYTFEAFWKFLRDYLKEIEGIACNSPKACFREALSSGLMSEEQAMACLRMTDDRNLTSHTYIQEVAEQIYRKISNYYELMENIFNFVKKRIGR
ncbi:MAG: HI0074 family nucleotidyltransferase substrate-binding subunit [Chloroflexota bacterium]|nr:HI0074 family nucleotidyltransferase substrate-binding subunit [Chloroflexota bacterium]